MQSYEIILGMSIAMMVVSLLSLYFNMRRDLMMLQQNSYMNNRYVRWFNQSGESTNYIRIGACIATFFCLMSHVPKSIAAGCAILLMVWIAISLLRRKYKKPLVVTKRVTRLMCVIALLDIAFAGITYFVSKDLYYTAVVATALNIVSPLVMLIANILLRPVEKHINNGFYKDAQLRLRSMPDLKIIGVTGSYGKTSTKTYLHRILSEKYDVVMTPGNFNTTLGVVRTVREHLKPYNEVFIVEMGAKQIGDIKEICDLVHPSIGIVTAVGEQHLESFKTVENVQRTKFELIDALPEDGLAIVNNDFAPAASRKVENAKCLRYAVQNVENSDYVATIKEVSPRGTTFVISGEGKEYTFSTRLVGECNVSNLMAAVIVALKLNVPEEKIAYAISKIEQVEHRLNMKLTAGGVTIIDDAYNSNPTGSKMALDVLSMMTQGKRIVVTPGMVELGEKQFELNKELGRYAASHADIIIVVGQYNKDAISEGLAEGEAAEDKVYFAATFNDAQQILAKILERGDTVLYENDLPDTFK